MLAVLVFILFLFICTSIYKDRKPWRVSASKRWLKNFRSNKKNYSSRQRFSYIRKVDHFLWEEILMSCFEERGYPVIRTKMTRDGGSDGFVTINGNFIVIQAKRYKGEIAKAHVMELDRLVSQNKRFNKGLLIHTGKSSAPILKHFKMNDHLEIISGVDAILGFLDGHPIHLFGSPLNKPN